MTQIKGNFKLISRFDLRRCHGSRPGVNTRSICSPYDISFDTGTQRMFYFPKFSSCFTLFLHKIDSFKSDNIILFCLIRTTFSKPHRQEVKNSKCMSGCFTASLKMYWDQLCAILPNGRHLWHLRQSKRPKSAKLPFIWVTLHVCGMRKVKKGNKRGCFEHKATTLL